MEKLPNAENAIINIRKLRNYCLNPNHPVGKHKAKVFKTVLGIGQSDAELLKELIIASLPDHPAELNFSDTYGTRYTVNLKIRILNNKEHIFTTGWIIRYDENFPRLITCYLKT